MNLVNYNKLGNLYHAVGRECANGHWTDEPDDDCFILLKGRRKYKTERGYEAVAPVPVNVSGNEWKKRS